jgi:hypothetical protein
MYSEENIGKVLSDIRNLNSITFIREKVKA